MLWLITSAKLTTLLSTTFIQIGNKMKLLCCAKCNQVFNLSFDYKECNGGHGGGQYIDRLNVQVWGDLANIFVLGFANTSFTGALRDQLNNGDQAPNFYYAGKMTPRGREFTAFVIPEAADSVIRVPDRFDPIEPAILSKTYGGSKFSECP